MILNEKQRIAIRKLINEKLDEVLGADVEIADDYSPYEQASLICEMVADRIDDEYEPT